jgi:membrane fusion protein (multidrug efflux system)
MINSKINKNLNKIIPATLVLVGLIVYFVLDKSQHTDNAQIKMSNVYLASEVMGQIKTINVKNNQQVKTGDVLLEIDNTVYEMNYKKGKELYNLKKEEFRKKQSLYNQRLISEIDFLALRAQLQEAESDFKVAENYYNKTKIISPCDCYVSNFELKEGDFLGQGQSILNLINTNNIWVEANFKETQLKYMRAGQKAKIIVDVNKSKKFKGVIDSISKAVNSEFSIFGSQNTTGNWVKVTQRNRVKITLDEGQDISILSSGMNSEVTVYPK